MKHEFKEVELVEMSPVEVEKMLNVLLLRKDKGYSQYELSFLLGQRDFYVRDIEDITHKLDYKVRFTNTLRIIFNCELPAIIPNINIEPSYQIKLLEYTNEVGHTVYKAERITEDGIIKEIVTFGIEEKLVTLPSESLIVEEQVIAWVVEKCESNYFDASKTALQVLKDCELEFLQQIRPLFLANALKYCNGRNGTPKIIKKKDENKRFVYYKQ